MILYTCLYGNIRFTLYLLQSWQHYTSTSSKNPVGREEFPRSTMIRDVFLGTWPIVTYWSVISEKEVARTVSAIKSRFVILNASTSVLLRIRSRLGVNCTPLRRSEKRERLRTRGKMNLFVQLFFSCPLFINYSGFLCAMHYIRTFLLLSLLFFSFLISLSYIFKNYIDTYIRV